MAGEEQMNRLVLIGNGFDLAHKLKTNYSDFIFNLIKESIIETISNYNENNLNPKKTNNLINFKTTKDTSHTNSLIEDIEKIDSSNNNKINALFSLLPDYNIEKEDSPDFLNDLINEYQNNNWVDIEGEYFNELLNIFNSVYDTSKKNNKKTVSRLIEQLNKSIDRLNMELKKYLDPIKTPVTSSKFQLPLHTFFEKCFDKLTKDELTALNLDIRQLDPENIMFLDFNYTNTVHQYVKHYKNAHHVQIHGSLRESKIIFGYGDDSHQNYQDLENEGNPELLRHIKSFQYPSNYNYHKFLNFIEHKEFDVFIVGHSCGLSDRTMLRTIFNHQNCKGIKIFVKEDNDKESQLQEHFYKTIAVSRHFKEKSEMRKKIIPYDINGVITQVKK